MQTKNFNSVTAPASDGAMRMNGTTNPGVGGYQVSNPATADAQPRDDISDIEAVPGNARLEDDVIIAEEERPASYFIWRMANEVIDEEKQRPNPRNLWNKMWFENEICCLFADSNVGKSILAVQIGAEVAASIPVEDKVLYFDFELTSKQFQRRYTNEETGSSHRFPRNFLRVEFDPNVEFNDNVIAIIAEIENVAKRETGRYLIIDNISWITAKSESGDVAATLMQELVKLKKRGNYSILVLAHTPKRNMNTPLTQNSLGGSKKLGNFMDAMMAIGHSKRGKGERYVIQLKVRSTEQQYGPDNVMNFRIEKDDNFLHFVHTGFSTEDDNLEEPDEIDLEKEESRNQIAALRAQGKTTREIKALGYPWRTIMSVTKNEKLNKLD